MSYQTPLWLYLSVGTTERVEECVESATRIREAGFRQQEPRSKAQYSRQTA